MNCELVNVVQNMQCQIAIKQHDNVEEPCELTQMLLELQSLRKQSVIQPG